MVITNRVNRDLKPENFLLADDTGISSAPLKIIDFGLSKKFMQVAIIEL